VEPVSRIRHVAGATMAAILDSDLVSTAEEVVRSVNPLSTDPRCVPQIDGTLHLVRVSSVPLCAQWLVILPLFLRRHDNTKNK